MPTDRKNQPLIRLDYEVSADDSVLVKTYHRTHHYAAEFARNVTEGLGDGEPVDIRAHQFVSVRVEMPVDSIWNQKQTEEALKQEQGS
ncbi:phage tail fiber protein [Enterobacter hormaechei]